MSDFGGSMAPPPYSTNQHAAGMANASSASQSGGRIRGAENLAELKASRGSRLTVLRRLLNRVTGRRR